MLTLADHLYKLGKDIDLINKQIETNIIELEKNKQKAVSEIFETDHEKNLIDISNYRDNNLKLKNILKVLMETKEDYINQAIELLTSNK